MTLVYNRYAEWRRSLNLTCPGPFESLHKEARSTSAAAMFIAKLTIPVDVSLTNVFFEGGKADLAKGLSSSFQVTHSFSLGSVMYPPSYNFGTVFVDGKHLIHGMLDTNGVMQGKYHYSPTQNLTAKIHSQLSSQSGNSMVQLEADYLGGDYSLNIKAINPDIASSSGIFTGSYLQSLTQRLALGVEAIVQKQPSEPIETGFNLAGRYALSNSILTVNLQQLVALQASYWHRVSEKVQLGTELQMLLLGSRKDALTTVAARFDYRQACIRAQLDSAGKVALLLEERLFPGFSLLIAGELDHVKNTSRFGVGMNLEN